MNGTFFAGLLAGLIAAPAAFFTAHQIGWWNGAMPMMGDGPHAPMMPRAQTQEPAHMSQKLQLALTTGDRQLVEQLLDPEVVIYESGGVEQGFAEYASHHLEADMAFLQGMQHEVLDEQTRVFGDQAVYWAHTRVQGTYKDKPMDLYSNETLWMHHVDGKWRIRHIHWSSRSAS